MAEETTQDFESIIKQISGEDETYANSLTQEVSNVLGYQNFKARQGKYKDIVNIPDLQSGAGAADFTPNLHGDLTPAGVKQQVSSNLNMRLDEMAYQKSLAKKSISDAKKAKEEKLKNALNFEEQDWLDSEIKQYMFNPFNEDGSLKTVDELREGLKGQAIGETDVTPDITDAKIDQKINERLPESWLNTEATEEDKMMDYYKMLGYTDAESKDLYDLNNYKNGKMTSVQKELFELKNPTLVKRAEKMEQYPELEKDLNNPDGLLPYDELKLKYPNLSNEELSDIAKPSYRIEIQKVVDSFVNETPDLIKKSQELPYAEIKKEYLADLLDKLTLDYAGALTRAEIEQMLYRKIYAPQSISGNVEGVSNGGGSF